ncbi:MAG TPA: GGDEF domain-containing protein [Gammaproteobacteria bacterium]|nr:GGDEF domain-containing protein [Gammaproteobacteria bacterium]
MAASYLSILKTACILVLLLGSVMHGYCLVVVRRLAQGLPTGRIRNKLILLEILIAGFALLYFVFALFGTSVADLELIVTVSIPLALMAGFVLLTCGIIQRTVGALLRVELAESQRIIDNEMGIYNRYYFKLRLREEYNLAHRHRLIFSVLLLAVDYLERVNYSYGRVYGGKLLSRLGELVKESVWQTDIVARYSGEEVAILLPHTGIAGAKVAAEKLRKRVEEKTFYLDDDHKINRVMIACTISIGIAVFTQDMKHMNQIMENADVALFKARDKGRNQVAIYGE